MSTGHYHHHLAGNVWHSSGAGRRDPDHAGLSWFVIEANDPADIEATGKRLAEQGAPVSAIEGGIETADPWGTRVRLVHT
jgi:catechol 2,3-dioxygenase